MLKTLLTPLTTASAGGVALRDIIVWLGALLAVIGALGLLTPEQVAVIQAQLDKLVDPKVLAAIGLLMSTAMSIYRQITKSSSDKAAEAAKAIDQEIPKNAQVEILTPGDKPNIIIQPKA